MKLPKILTSPITGYVVIGLGALFIVLGIFRDEITTVFYKAAAICMECIGIG